MQAIIHKFPGDDMYGAQVQQPLSSCYRLATSGLETELEKSSSAIDEVDLLASRNTALMWVVKQGVFWIKGLTQTFAVISTFTKFTGEKKNSKNCGGSRRICYSHTLKAF